MGAGLKGKLLNGYALVPNSIGRFQLALDFSHKQKQNNWAWMEKLIVGKANTVVSVCMDHGTRFQKA